MKHVVAVIFVFGFFALTSYPAFAEREVAGPVTSATSASPTAESPETSYLALFKELSEEEQARFLQNLIENATKIETMQTGKETREASSPENEIQGKW